MNVPRRPDRLNHLAPIRSGNTRAPTRGGDTRGQSRAHRDWERSRADVDGPNVTGKVDVGGGRLPPTSSDACMCDGAVHAASVQEKQRSQPLMSGWIIHTFGSQ